MDVVNAFFAERVQRRDWRESYSRSLFFCDLIVVTVAVFFSQLWWIGVGSATLVGEWVSSLDASYTLVSSVVIVCWMFLLSTFATRDRLIVGHGNLEYRRVTDATFLLFGLFAMASFLLRIELGRGYLLTALPLGLILLLSSRLGARKWLRRRQSSGRFLSPALLLGDRLKSEHVALAVLRTEGTGLKIVGALTQDGVAAGDLVHGVPVLGCYEDLLAVVDETAATTLILTGADDISPADMRRIGWDLDARSVELIVAPALTDIAGPRIHARPVAGLPLIHVDYPAFVGSKRFAKRLFDIVGSSTLILLFSPILVAVALAVRYSGPGNIIYRQERIGRHGLPFDMLKFRSMKDGADDELKSLLDAQGSSDIPLFKVRDDPRITPVGKALRRYSLDELPQLFNVLIGMMSLVGPRPQRPAEVALYTDEAHRRLYMKPGMSGLWQVSGRSKLSWEDSIRLDLYYIENWSLIADIQILWRTIRAVVRSDGAV
jgi:exopolysaccharide biosynthesis polyprenyl glycosylphosphotransferase